MIGEPPPLAERDQCVWCGARPLRVGFADDPLAWFGGDSDCSHETCAVRDH